MRVWGGIIALLLAGCASRVPLGELAATHPTLAELPVCHGHGCKIRTVVSLDETQWGAVTAIFEPLPESPADERERIARAIGELERLVGAKAGTAHDSGQNQLIGASGQLDCVDETANTQTYLRLLQNAGLLRWHAVASPASRGWPEDTWVHNTAVVAMRDTGTRYAVDSWFFDNGEPAVVVPLQDWLDGWEPGDESGSPASLDAGGDAPSTPDLMPLSDVF